MTVPAYLNTNSFKSKLISSGSGTMHYNPGWRETDKAIKAMIGGF